MPTPPAIDSSPTHRPPPDRSTPTSSTPAQKKAEPRAAVDGSNGYQDFIALLTYIEEVSEAPASELRALAASLGPDAEEAYLTTADMLRAEGRAETLMETLAKALTVKFGPLADSVTTTLRGATSDQLQAWIIRAMTAETLDQVFALAAECGFGGPAAAQRPVASGQFRPRPRRPVADIISEQRHLRTAALTAAIAGASLSQQIDAAIQAAGGDDSGQAAAAAGRLLLAADDEW
jgi:hypothetical protein